MLYSRAMLTDRSLTIWIQRLRSWGLAGMAADVLDGAGPLALLGAQALYAAAPALRLVTPEAEIVALAQALEDPQAAAAFARQLGEEAAA